MNTAYKYGQSHGFGVDAATDYGMAGAVLIRYFQFWITTNRAKDDHFIDGHTWTYTTMGALGKIFPYMNVRKIRRELHILVDKGVLLRDNFNKSKYNRTAWYAFADEERFLSQSSGLPAGGVPPEPPGGDDSTPPFEPPKVAVGSEKCGGSITVGTAVGTALEKVLPDFAEKPAQPMPKSKLAQKPKKKPPAKKKPDTNPDVKLFIDEFCKWYLEDFGRKYRVKGAQDGALVKSLLEDITFAELEDAAERMFKDDWAIEKGAVSIGLLSTGINRWLNPELGKKPKDDFFGANRG